MVYDIVFIYLFVAATSVLDTDSEIRIMMMSGAKAYRKVPGCVPHDVGDPGKITYF